MVSLPPWEDSPWLKRLESELLVRSRFLPSGYRFFLQRTIRELVPICSVIASQIVEDELPVNKAILLASDLLQMTAWSMVAGIENLIWYGWGVELDWGPLHQPPSPRMSKFLNSVRNGGEMSMEELEQKARRLQHGERHKVLEILNYQGHLNLETRKFSPISLAKYIESKVWRSCLPSLDLLTTPYYREVGGKGG